MADDVKVQVRGLRELRSALKKVNAETGTALKEGFKEIATNVADAARRKVPIRTGRARGSVKGRGSQTGGAIAFGGNAAPYYPWLDFGGHVGRHNRLSRPFIKEGRYVYPTISEKNEYIIKATDDLIERVIEGAGFETKGGE